jgi:MoxR-like ATPase
LSAIGGKDSVSAELVKSLVQKVLAHRLIVRREEKFRGVKVADVITEILQQTAPK